MNRVVLLIALVFLGIHASFAQAVRITGSVSSLQDGYTLPGAVVMIKGTNIGTVTDAEGNYIIEAAEGDVLDFRMIGFESQSVTIGKRFLINVSLKEQVNTVDEVVVTGIVTRKRSDFTGAVASASGEELKVIGNSNVLQSLQTLDPSFVIEESSTLGSNPNATPEIEVRGATSITGVGLNDEFGGDPNQPLFILDGFETTLQTIVDLDMNRVASITVLKDASSTALYGAKAANGVVVVETIKPEVGKVEVAYNGDFRFEIPDLSDYNLMNASQKLEFEVLSGRWTASSGSADAQLALDEQYNAILAEIQRGVDTYWLNEPLQVGTSVGNSIRVSGGESSIRYGVGLNYKTLDGVMIGSGRKTWGADFSLNYRKDKINISNQLYINGYNATDSNYGDFSEYAQANPYYRKEDENGDITKYLDSNVQVQGLGSASVENPLYQSTLNSFDETENVSITNNLNAIWTLSDRFRWQTSLQLTTRTTTGEVFLAPEEVQFDSSDLDEKGQYTNNKVESSSYTFNTMLTYSTVLNGVHRINANGRFQFGQTVNNRYTTVAIGYPDGTNGNPSFAGSYDLDSSPGTADSKYRRVNFLASANYSYDNRYLVDLTYRLDGSTVFGSNELFSPFWAAGLGWNMHEDFNFDQRKISLLKLRANVGYTGNQNFGSSASSSIYEYNDINNIFGQGVIINTLGNPDLQWQKTLSISTGIDGNFFNKRLTTTLNAYQKITDPLVVVADLPSSTGVSGYPINAGDLTTTGYEVILRFSPVYNLQKGHVWTLGVTGSFVSAEYDNFDNKLNSLNESAQESSSLIRYKDGFSPDDIWAVKSLGIDPANGQEVFETLEGKKTYDYNANDIQVMGNTRPTVEGVLSSNLRIKNFSLGVNLRYRLGGDVFNNALYNKVENISATGVVNNQDVRALTDRWKNPGDVASFKAISITSTTPISSRFIQKENTLTGESINIGYDFKDQMWISKIGLSRLRVRGYLNDIFRISTVRTERGTSYPFARSLSFSVNANF